MFAIAGGHEYRLAEITHWILACGEDDGNLERFTMPQRESELRFVAAANIAVLCFGKRRSL
jgi:hypothetical protein